MNIQRTFIPAVILATVVLSACGPRRHAADALRPGDPNVADATGRGACTDPSQRVDALVVDLPPEKRADLEAAMKQGVAVVSYDCKTLRILTDCQVKGRYNYVAVSPKEQLVKLTDADQVRAKLPVTGAMLAVRLEGHLKRGASLDVAMKMVGKQMSQPMVAHEDDLVGQCKGATHIVRGATLGAFVMKTSTKADIHAAAQVFSASGSASSTSDRSVLNRDGDPSQCDAASANDQRPPARCQAVLRLELSPVEEILPTVGNLSDHPEDAKLAPKPLSCHTGEIDKCTRLCDAGDVTACFALAVSYHRGENVSVDVARASKLYGRSCDRGFQPACVIVGIQYLAGPEYPKGIRILDRACKLREATACSSLGFAYEKGKHKDLQKAYDYYKKACALGDGKSCREVKKFK